MGSTQDIVDELMTESGKGSQAVRRRIETKVGEITIDLLSQHEGRFQGLMKTLSLTLTTSDNRRLKLPVGFNRIQSLDRVNSDGVFIGSTTVAGKDEIRQMIEDGRTMSLLSAYIENVDSGSAAEIGWWLVFSGDPSETIYFELDYYRKPKPTDTHLIRNELIVKLGVRGYLHDLFPGDNQAELADYLGRRRGFRERHGRKRTRSVLRPSKSVARRNVFMHNIGKQRR